MEIRIDETNADQRLDRFMRKWCKAYPEVKLSDIYSWIRKGVLKVNGKKSKEQYRVQIWDEITIADGAELGKKDPKALIAPKDRKLKKLDIDKIRHWILHEDDNWVVWNKPAGIVIHPSNSHWKDLCMNDYLEKYCDTKKSDTFKPSFGYRLDKDTSGVLIAAKNYESLQYINQVIRERRVSKKYMALVIGKFPDKLVSKKKLEKVYDRKFDRSHMVVSDVGIDAHTEFKLEKTIKHPVLRWVSLVKVTLHTGRMHQIRAHLADAGYPILWDIIYGSPVVNRKMYKEMKINRQMLHCWEYGFDDKFAQKFVKFQADLPQDFIDIITNEKKE